MLENSPNGGSRSWVRVLLGGIVSVGSLSYLLWQVGWPQFDNAVRSVPLPALIIAFVALVMSVVLAAWRLIILGKYVGHRIALSAALAAVCLGQLASLLLFQIFGQLIVRGAILKRSGVPAGTSVYLTLYERLTALVLLLIFASLGALWIFGSISIDFQSGGRDFVALIAGGLFVLVFSAPLAWGHQLKSAWAQIESGFIVRTLLNAAVTVGIQICTLIAFVALASAIAPAISLLKIAAASTIVMFAAAFPISMAGWGVRELGAVFALGAIGLPQSDALLVGLVIGVLSLLTNMMMGFAGSFFLTRPQTIAPDAKPHGNPMTMLGMFVPVLVAMAIFFQIHVPVAGTTTNVNFADPMVLLGGGLFLLLIFQGRPQWRLNHMHFFIALMSAVIVSGFVHGLYVIGWTQWAATKVFGWLLILSYGSTGALIVRTAQGAGLKIVVKTIVSSVAAIVSFYLFFMALTAVKIDPFAIPARIPGFAVDPNAFAFQILVAIAILLGCLGTWKWKGSILVLLTIGVGLTGSRSGAIGLATITIAYMAVKRKLDVPVLANIMTGNVALLAIRVLLGSLDGHQSEGLSSLAFATATPGSTTEHFATVVAGLQLFIRHPLFGNGLGYFMATYWKDIGGYAHPIDSTAVSLLAEMGAVGFAAFLLPFLTLLVAEWRRVSASQDNVAVSIVLALAAFASMGVFYDLLYQRLLWFVLGILIASEAKQPGSAEPFAAAKVVHAM